MIYSQVWERKRRKFNKAGKKVGDKGFMLWLWKEGPSKQGKQGKQGGQAGKAGQASPRFF